jgi:HEPN domain-containing protein
MPHDPELVAETRAWLIRAKRDIDAGAFELTASRPFSADAVFHAQQAAEKSLKAFLT